MRDLRDFLRFQGKLAYLMMCCAPFFVLIFTEKPMSRTNLFEQIYFVKWYNSFVSLGSDPFRIVRFTGYETYQILFTPINFPER